MDIGKPIKVIEAPAPVEDEPPPEPPEDETLAPSEEPVEVPA
jgi:hypothetical protein